MEGGYHFPRIFRELRSFRQIENIIRRSKSILSKNYFNYWIRFTFFNFININAPIRLENRNFRKIEAKNEIIQNVYLTICEVKQDSTKQISISFPVLEVLARFDTKQVVPTQSKCENQFKCLHCPLKLKTQVLRDNHYSNIHNPTYFRCLICSIIIKSRTRSTHIAK